jgi:DMSO/TMAO reductase YedYZ molybdopterin-dependent catalytic subunit
MSRRHAALAGLAAAGAALGVAEVVGILSGARYAPVVAVGGVVIDHVPEWGKEFAINVFGTHDKLALQIGTLIILAGIAAVIGILAARNRWLGVAGIALFGVIGAVAAQTRPDASGWATFPSLIGAAAGVGVLLWLLDRAPGSDSWLESDASQPSDASPQSDASLERETQRRRFIALGGGTLVAAVIAGVGGRFFATQRGVAASRRAVVLPTPSETLPDVPPTEFDPGIGGASRFITSNQDFYRIDTAIIVPQVEPLGWKLKIYGRVKNPRTITWDELLKMPTIERYATLTCVSNEVGDDLIGNAKWLGIPIKPLLDEAEPFDDADQVISRSVDGFTAGTPTAVLRDGRDAMLAIGMNGEPLPVKHGFPVRMVVPGLYGYVSATKWLKEWQVTRFADYDAYWVPRGWARQAPIKTQSRIDTPKGTIDPGRRTIAGVAWAQHRGITKVEVRVDDGPWQQATLAAVPSVDTWRLWTLPWDASSGKHRITVRATDYGGVTQTEQDAPPAPDGATGWHTVTVTVR